MNIWVLQTASGIWYPDCSKLARNRKNDNDVTNCRHDVIVKFSWRFFVSLVTFSDWSKFHVNIVTGSGVITIFYYKGFTRNLEIGNTSVWVLPSIWKLGQVRNTKFGTKSLIKYYRMLQNAKVTAFTVSELLRQKPKRGIRLPSAESGWPRLGLKNWQVCQL